MKGYAQSSSVQYRRSISGEIELDENIFGIEINKALLHQVVRMQLNNQGTQSVQTRAEVRGAEQNPEARNRGACHGSTRSPIWVGAVLHGTKPRDYRFRILRCEDWP